MTILGISAFYHDSAAAIVQDGKIVAAAQEERFTRKKHDPAFPTNAVKYCLEYTGKTIDQLDAVVFYDKPLLKFERLLETYYGFSPKGVQSFITAIPVWLKEKMFLKKLIKDELKEIQSYDKKKLKLLFPEHHLSHAASAFYPSPYEKAAILTLDGVGEWATASICVGEGKNITMLKELQFPHSVGLLYSAFTYFLGFKVNSGEYKLMGLAPYGNPKSERVQKFKEIIKTKLIKINDDGSIWLDQKYFNYAVGLRMVYDKKWEELFGFPRRTSESEFEQQHSDLGLAIQEVTEEIIIKLAKHAKEITGADYLCMAGGVALNCVANGKLQNENIFKEIFIQPAAGDAGGSLGAALTAYYTYFDQERVVEPNDAMSGSYLGPEFSDLDVEKINRKYNATSTYFSDFSKLTKEVATYISEGNAIGWMQGRMEFGPRALGRRSILGDARNPEMQKKLNLKIKYRESFRPFAPSVLSEDVNEFFDYEGISPYMLLVHKVHPKIKHEIPVNYHELPIREKLYVQRSSLPAITHIDFSGRIQTVHKDTNSEYWELINEFKKITGVGVVVNTSFNVRGEPIVCTPDDAYRCFMRTEMDYLVIGNYVYKKEDQPSWQDTDDWKEEFLLD
ncbi:decarbamoylnovobiocin carbamoyltransferase [Kordia sp. SMS9]|uniref:carbamoyltransferase family protein n=1 Tax=Kordia sp. SMS9 TaxID=2282170 RepID=UPI000E0DCF72|nr:carbamoyltransferase [Kordia sp. SMS9]AXG71358.1 decarbamoylnovobiocin carbamoyltransferase [Kordia sp. SMS9]